MRRAVKKYGQYLKHRPEDVVVQEKFALLAADLANMPGSSQEEMRLAYRALDVAAKHPELVEVRRRIIDYYMRLGRYVDASGILGEIAHGGSKRMGTREPDARREIRSLPGGVGTSKRSRSRCLTSSSATTKRRRPSMPMWPPPHGEIDAYLALQKCFDVA